ncbi:MAG: hypothetical protein AAGG48_31575, partial [Planctomycetota bacterium]
MNEPIFDHNLLDVDRLPIEYVASSIVVAKELSGSHRNVRDAEYEYRDAEYEYRDAEYEYRD